MEGRGEGPLKHVEDIGRESGQIRLSRQWRAIYTVMSRGRVESIEIQEVNPHAY